MPVFTGTFVPLFCFVLSSFIIAVSKSPSSRTISSDESKDNAGQKSPEIRIKLGEALVKATRSCGELLPRYSQQLVSALLSGVRDPDHLVRASSLSNLGDVCKLLRFSLGSIVHEVRGPLGFTSYRNTSISIRTLCTGENRSAAGEAEGKGNVSFFFSLGCLCQAVFTSA